MPRYGYRINLPKAIQWQSSPACGKQQRRQVIRRNGDDDRKPEKKTQKKKQTNTHWENSMKMKWRRGCDNETCRWQRPIHFLYAYLTLCVSSFDLYARAPRASPLLLLRRLRCWKLDDIGIRWKAIIPEPYWWKVSRLAVSFPVSAEMSIRHLCLLRVRNLHFASAFKELLLLSLNRIDTTHGIESHLKWCMANAISFYCSGRVQSSIFQLILKNYYYKWSSMRAHWTSLVTPWLSCLRASLVRQWHAMACSLHFTNNYFMRFCDIEFNAMFNMAGPAMHIFSHSYRCILYTLRVTARPFHIF